MSNWTPNSWRALPIKQQPEYDNPTDLEAVTTQLKTMPELVSFDEINKLKYELAEVSQGKAFLLQGGDCAETFAEFNNTNLRNYFKAMLQMTGILMYGTGLPIVKIGRIAGQFVKPRSSGMEAVDGVELPSYRGDMVNDLDFTDAARKPKPENLLKAFHQSATTLNYLRALAYGGFANLNKINRWNIDFVKASKQGQRYQKTLDAIGDAMHFMEACRLPVAQIEALSTASFYTSHEGLLLPYEEALIRKSKADGKYYCCSAHMLWIGDRTRKLDEAHIEFMRGIENPIGCKVGPSMTNEELLAICDTLNPNNEHGKIVLISRMGKDKVGKLLPGFVELLKCEGKNVVWSCDPMHGNTIKTGNGYKSRKFDDILSEVQQFLQIHKAAGTHAGGVHFEMTGQDVTECLGGAQEISELNLEERYQTACDPRLNASQALELAFLISEELRG